MKNKNVKTTIAAFETLQIKTAQQLEVKGGTNGEPSGFIGSDDQVVM